MWALLARIGPLLARLFAGPAAAREAGRLEQQAAMDRQTLTTIKDIHDEQAAIAARPDAGPDALLGRMRDGTL